VAQLDDDGPLRLADAAGVKSLRCACGRELCAETGEELLAAVERHLAEALAGEHMAQLDDDGRQQPPYGRSRNRDEEDGR
jgi:hypothetical protein